MFEAMDSRKSGYISREAFELSLAQSGWTTVFQKEGIGFDDIDTDKNGFLSKKELYACLLTVAPKYPGLIGHEMHIIVLGNPGVGKSTILNSLIGKVVFSSSVSVGTGRACLAPASHLLEQVASYTLRLDGVKTTFIDTPGLDDIRSRKEAAKQIQRALSYTGFYKVFFAQTLRAGRAEPSSATTIKTVLEAVPAIKSYGIIVNQITPDEMERLSPDEFKGIRAHLLTGIPRFTDQIFYQKEFPEIRCKDDLLLPDTSELQAFIQATHSNIILHHDVSALRVQDFDEAKQQLMDLHKQIVNSSARHNQELKEIQETLRREKRKREETLAELDQLRQQLAKKSRWFWQR